MDLTAKYGFSYTILGKEHTVTVTVCASLPRGGKKHWTVLRMVGITLPQHCFQPIYITRDNIYQSSTNQNMRDDRTLIQSNKYAFDFVMSD